MTGLLSVSGGMNLGATNRSLSNAYHKRSLASTSNTISETGQATAVYVCD